MGHRRHVVSGGAVNYADRLALSLVIVAKDFQAEVIMDDVGYSRVVAAFFLAYAIMYAGSGYIVDRLGTKRGFAFFIGLWSRRRCCMPSLGTRFRSVSAVFF